jgi:diacylglycerol diphosphate phosphatase/phosphatidate phosphatase
MATAELEFEQNKTILGRIIKQLDTVVLFTVIGIIVVLQFFEPFKRPFDRNDSSIALPSQPDIIPDSLLISYAAVLPVVVLGLVIRQLGPTLYMLQSYLIGLGFTISVTEFLKLSVGRLRPDFLSRCAPDLLNVCTGNSKTVADGRKSFPSGHASISFYATAFLVFYMKRQGFELIGIRAKRRGTSAFVILLSLGFLLIPTYFGISRYLNSLC